jgi:hypothetical protein
MSRGTRCSLPRTQRSIQPKRSSRWLGSPLTTSVRRAAKAFWLFGPRPGRREPAALAPTLPSRRRDDTTGGLIEIERKATNPGVKWPTGRRPGDSRRWGRMQAAAINPPTNAADRPDCYRRDERGFVAGYGQPYSRVDRLGGTSVKVLRVHQSLPTARQNS